MLKNFLDTFLLMKSRFVRLLPQVSKLFGSSTPVDIHSTQPPARTLSGFFFKSSTSKEDSRETQSLPGDAVDGEEHTGGGNIMKTHVKARCQAYPRSETNRQLVPDDKVSWSVPWEAYSPVDFTSDSVKAKPVWADEDFREQGNDACPKWNKLDGKINRRSFTGKYEIVDGVPRNPVGRTGMRGRGCLGRWGPNHAADPIVTRFQRDKKGEVVKDSQGRPILEFIAIQRRDNGEWAIPGGMVDKEEVVTQTIRREFGEEALNSLEASEEEKKKINATLDTFFQMGIEMYRGYVDDPRNTDNAWMETVAMMFHDSDGSGVAQFKLNAGDDAVGVKWLPLSKDLKLYASHSNFLQSAAEKLGASW